MSTFGHTLLALRTRMGLSRDELGKLLGVSRTTVGNWETGKDHPRHKRLEKIADTLGVTVPQLAGGDLTAVHKQDSTLISVQYEGDELPLVAVGAVEPALWAKTKQRVIVVQEKSGRRFGIVATDETIRSLEDCLAALRGFS